MNKENFSMTRIIFYRNGIFNRYMLWKSRKLSSLDLAIYLGQLKEKFSNEFCFEKPSESYSMLLNDWTYIYKQIMIRGDL